MLALFEQALKKAITRNKLLEEQRDHFNTAHRDTLVNAAYFFSEFLNGFQFTKHSLAFFPFYAQRFLEKAIQFCC